MRYPTEPQPALGWGEQPAPEPADSLTPDLRRKAHALSVREQAFDVAAATLGSRGPSPGVAQAVAEVLLHSLDAAGCALLRIDPDRRVLVPILVVGDSPRADGRPLPLESLAGRSAMTGEPLVSDTTLAIASEAGGRPPAPGSCAVVPAQFPDGSRGVLEVVNARLPSGFNSDDIATALGVLPALVLALTLGSRSATQQRELADLQMLSSVGKRIAQHEDTGGMLREAVAAGLQAVGAEAGLCFLIEEGSSALALAAAVGVPALPTEPYRVPWGQALAGSVAAEGQPAVVRAADGDPRLEASLGQAVGLQVRDALCVPLRSGDALLGAVQLLNSARQGGFQPRDAELLGAVLDQAAGILQRALQADRSRRSLAATIESIAQAANPDHPSAHCSPQLALPLARGIGRQLGLSAEDQRTIDLALVLHDVGRANAQGDSRPPGRDLTAAEAAALNSHPVVGAAVLHSLRDTSLGGVVAAIRHHHEWFDGRGYPDGLADDDIPLASRVVAAIHAFLAMTEGRPYQAPHTTVQALDELRRWAGSQFDPRVIEALIAHVTAGGAVAPSSDEDFTQPGGQ